MANVTDPFARSIHGTNPQNLIEYITRQRIYDSQYWKAECFGLTALDVTEKAAIQLQAIGGSYGGNSKPTRFLCLILKMLQIQPDESIVDELVSNEDFKYARALGAFYLRLTGRPPEIYQKLEPLYHDYQQMKLRNPTGWTLTHMDEFVDSLLKEDRVCGISLPRLPKRSVLLDGGYLDGPRISAIHSLLSIRPTEKKLHDEDFNSKVDLEACMKNVEQLLVQMARDGNTNAKEALEKKKITINGMNNEREREQKNFNKSISLSETKAQYVNPEKMKDTIANKKSNRSRKDSINAGNNDDRALDHSNIRNDAKSQHSSSKSRLKKEKKEKPKKKNYGTLFKQSSSPKRNNDQPKQESISTKDDRRVQNANVEGSEEYWNEQRKKLGLKPLQR